MQLKSKFIKTALITAAVSLGTVLSGAASLTAFSQEKEQPQVVIQSNNYAVGYKHCEAACVAEVRADANTSIYVEYKLDDASVESLDILNVVRDDETLNAYVDRDEIAKINAAIVGGVQ